MTLGNADVLNRLPNYFGLRIGLPNQSYLNHKFQWQADEGIDKQKDSTLSLLRYPMVGWPLDAELKPYNLE